jgi:hypothetical protein
MGTLVTALTIVGAIMRPEEPAADVNTVNTLEVESFDEFADRIRAAGRKLISPKQEIPRGGLPRLLRGHGGQTLRADGAPHAARVQRRSPSAGRASLQGRDTTKR